MAHRRISSTAPAIERAVGPQRRQLVGVLEEGEQPRAEHRLGRVVAGGDELDEERAEVDVAHRRAAEVAVEDQGGEVLLRRLGAALGGEADGVHGHLDRGAVVDLADDVGVLARRLALGQRVEQGPVVLGQAHQPAHHLGGDVGGDVVDEVDLAPLGRRRPGPAG